MGFLEIFGIALDFKTSQKYFEIIRENFIEYVINHINKLKKLNNLKPLFGYELEFHKIIVDHNSKKVYLDLRAQNDIMRLSNTHLKLGYNISHEFGGWMIESMHDMPFSFEKIKLLYKNVKKLYEYLNNKFGDESILSISTYPMLGVGNFFREDENNIYEQTQERLKKSKLNNNNIDNNNRNNKEIESMNNTTNSYINEYYKKINPISQSLYFPDVCINHHPRFSCLARNIRERRGKKVEIKVPIFKDENTDVNNNIKGNSFEIISDTKNSNNNIYENTNNINEKNINKNEPYPGYIYMDAMGFGMGNSAMQITLGAKNLESAQNLYDQLIPFCPIFLALTSCSPIFKGKISAFDNRFSVISQSVDDRTDEERDPKSPKYIYKSRYSPIYSYIGESAFSKDFFNDYPKFPISEKYFEKLKKGGISEKLAKHFCNLLVRDPLVVFSEKGLLKDREDISHFENINSSNWNSLRFKLPRSSDGDSCFKIEVRACELQIAPFSNSATMILIILIMVLINDGNSMDNEDNIINDNNSENNCNSSRNSNSSNDSNNIFNEFNEYKDINFNLNNSNKENKGTNENKSNIKVHKNIDTNTNRKTNEVNNSGESFKDISKTIIKNNKINYIIPISKVDENFERAYHMGNIDNAKYYWRVNSDIDYDNLNEENDKNNIKELSIDEIFNGCERYNYEGILPKLERIVKKYYKNDYEEIEKVIQYFKLKSKGEIWTDAKYIRYFVLNHKDYKKNSIITDKINYDLVCHLIEIMKENILPKELFGNILNTNNNDTFKD